MINLDLLTKISSVLPNMVPLEAAIGFFIIQNEKKERIYSDDDVSRAMLFLKRIPIAAQKKYLDTFESKMEEVYNDFVIELPTISADKVYGDLEAFNSFFEGVAMVKPISVTKYFDKLLDEDSKAHIDVEITYNSVSKIFGVYPSDVVIKKVDFFNNKFNYNGNILGKPFLSKALTYFVASVEPRNEDCWKEVNDKNIFELNVEGYYLTKILNEVNKFVTGNIDKLEEDFF